MVLGRNDMTFFVIKLPKGQMTCSVIPFRAICHLLCILLLGIALGRARIIPIWAATALILVSPLTIISSSVHIAILLYLAMTLRVIGCFPAALAMLKEGWPIPAKKV